MSSWAPHTFSKASPHHPFDPLGFLPSGCFPRSSTFPQLSLPQKTHSYLPGEHYLAIELEP